VSDYDLQRVVGTASDGLQGVRNEYPDARLDGFVIVGVFAYTDEREEEREFPIVWSESRRHYPKVGMLTLGLDVIRHGFINDDDEAPA